MVDRISFSSLYLTTIYTVLLKVTKYENKHSIQIVIQPTIPCMQSQIYIALMFTQNISISYSSTLRLVNVQLLVTCAGTTAWPNHWPNIRETKLCLTVCINIILTVRFLSALILVGWSSVYVKISIFDSNFYWIFYVILILFIETSWSDKIKKNVIYYFICNLSFLFFLFVTKKCTWVKICPNFSKRWFF